MNKEIKDRLEKLENELKESKNEIHSLKSSVSLTIERGIRKLLSRFTRKQIILGSRLSNLYSWNSLGVILKWGMMMGYDDYSNGKELFW